MRTTCLWVTWRASTSSRLKRRSTSPAELRIEQDLRPDHLQRDGNAELVIPGLIDDAHAAGAERPDDVIAAAEGLARSSVDPRARQPAGPGRRVQLLS